MESNRLRCGWNGSRIPFRYEFIHGWKWMAGRPVSAADPGVASVDDCVHTGCCTGAGGLCNSPDDQVSADEICRLLGYSTATFVGIDSNGCPESHYAPVTGWTTDGVYSQGYGMSYTCTGA